MPVDHFMAVLDNISNTENPQDIMVMLTGGEPLLRPDLVECARRIYERKFPWGIQTNATLLTESLLGQLTTIGLKRLVVGIDGLPYEHRWLRGDEECYQQTVDAVRMACQVSGLEVEVTTCVNQYNFDYLHDIRQMLAELGVKHWRLYIAYPQRSIATLDDLSLDSYQIRQLMVFIQQQREKTDMDVYYTCEGFLGKYEKVVRDDFYRCHSGVSIGSVMINGDITGCPNVKHKFAQGNIYEGDEFMDIWNTCFDVFRQRKWMHTGICTHCKAFRYCQGGPMHLRDNTGDLILCNYDRINPK